MSNTSVGALNRALQEAHEWIQELSSAAPFGSDEQAYTGLRAVLHSLRDRLTVEEAVHLSAQLPMLVRGFYFEGWRPSLAPNEEQTAAEFFASVQESLRNAAVDLDAEQLTRAVFAFLENKISAGQLHHVRSQLPKEIQALWPSQA